MTRNDLLWLSHFLRRVVTHDQTEIEQLWRLVGQIEKLLNTRSSSTLPTGKVTEPWLPR